MIECTSELFEKEILGNQQTLSIVVFWADWCGPCHLQEPIVKKLAAEFAGKGIVCRVNVDEQEALADRYGIKTLPTTIVFAEGKILDTLVGFQAEEYLRAYLEQWQPTVKEKAE